jgi:hypothetical protein
MKNLKSIAFLLMTGFFLAFFLSQCATKKVLLSSGIVNKVVLLQTTVNFQQPTGISGPAAIARSQFKNHADVINGIMSFYIDTLRSAVVSNLKSKLGCDVLYGKALQALNQSGEIRKKYEFPDALIKEDDNFPEVVISSGDFNSMITGTKTGVLSGGFTVGLSSDQLKTTIINLCKDLNARNVAFADFVLSGYKSDIITPTSTSFSYTMLLFNQDGDLIAGSNYVERSGKFMHNDPGETFKGLIASYLQKSELIEIVSRLN